jgi:hypothetical protein
MRRLVAISILFLAAFAIEGVGAEFAPTEAFEVANEAHREQLVSSNRCNDDAEPATVLELPSVRTIAVKGPRTQNIRETHIAATGHFYTTSRYVVAHFLYRLGTQPRAVDYYLYTLCQLRL